MKPLDFYETVAIVCPGIVFLLGLYWFCPSLVNVQGTSQLFDISIGAIALSLIVAFICGHYIQIVAKVWETPFWWIQGGLPSSWIKKDGRLFSKDICQNIKNNLKKDNFEIGNKTDWKALNSFLKNSVDDSSKRVYAFNSQYGMFRGITCSFMCLAVLVLYQKVRETDVSMDRLYFCLFFIIMGLFRMRHFGVCYARELYIQYLTTKHNNITTSAHKG